MLDREVYYENSNVLDIKDYSYMMKTIQASSVNRCSGKDRIRKIYFNNDINYLEGGWDTSASDKDIYSIVMVNFDREHLMVERKSRRSDMIYKDYAPYEVLATKWLPFADVLRLKQVEDMEVGLV